MDPEYDFTIARDTRPPGTRKGAADDWPRYAAVGSVLRIDVDAPIEESLGSDYLALILEGGASF